MPKRAWLIQGFFFQERMFLGVKHRAESEGGVGVFMQPGIMSHMWSGVIWTTEDDKLTGELLDDFGDSVLTNIEITDDKLSFTKRYHQRGDDIQYTFAKVRKHWVGEYSGDAVGKGTARCILTEPSEEFFSLEGIMVR